MISKPPDIVVIAGLSGVGKSYVINQLKEGSDHFVNFSAGTLIKKRRSNMTRDDLRLLDEHGILQNQYFLIEQFMEEICSLTEHNTILFDAHILIDTDKKIIEIPLEIFSNINPSGFILLYDDPKTILKQRYMDISRKRPERSLTELRSQQDRSLSLAKIYAEQLNIPIMITTSKEIIQIRIFLSKLRHMAFK